jgi:hypothetical protein
MGIHSSLPDFREFRFPSDHPYLLDWLGGIYPNPRDPGNPLVECIFTPMAPREPDLNSNNGKSAYIRKVSEQVRVGVGVGNLSNLFVDRYVRAGQFLENLPTEARDTERITFEIDTADPAASSDGFLKGLNLELSQSPISGSLHARGVDSPIKHLRGTLTSTTNKSAPQTGPTWAYGGLDVVIQELELIRFYYTNSSGLARAVFSGSFGSDRLEQTVISDEPNSTGYDPDSDTHYFVHRLGFDEGDMPILGRILFEPNNLALIGARRINSSLRASNINNPGNRTANYPRTTFPFAQKTVLTLVGRRAKRQNGPYVFLVHRIERCAARFPFRNLRFASIRTVATGPAEVDPADVRKPNQPRVRGPVNKIEDQLESQNRSDVHPNAHSIPIAREIGTRVYSGLEYVNSQREVRESDRPRGKPRFNVFDPSLTDMSTGKPGYGITTAAKLTIKERIDSAALTADLDTFVKAVDALCLARPDWAIEFVPVGDSPSQDPVSGAYRGFFPLVNCRVRQSMLFKFSFIDDARTIRRQLIGVQIEVPGRFLYLFEAQRRARTVPTDVGPTTQYLETLPILLLHRDDFSQANPSQDFEMMLRGTVLNESKTWPSEVDCLVKTTIEHGRGADSVEALAHRIEAAVTGAIISSEVAVH